MRKQEENLELSLEFFQLLGLLFFFSFKIVLKNTKTKQKQKKNENPKSQASKFENLVRPT